MTRLPTAAVINAKRLNQLSAVEQIEAATRVEAELRGIVDKAIREARRDGSTFAEIGEALGVSKQAAEQRHRRLLAGRSDSAVLIDSLRERAEARELPEVELTPTGTMPEAGRWDPATRTFVAADIGSAPLGGGAESHLRDVLLPDVAERFDMNARQASGLLDRRAHHDLTLPEGLLRKLLAIMATASDEELRSWEEARPVTGGAYRRRGVRTR